GIPAILRTGKRLVQVHTAHLLPGLPIRSAEVFLCKVGQIFCVQLFTHLCEWDKICRVMNRLPEQICKLCAECTQLHDDTQNRKPTSHAVQAATAGMFGFSHVRPVPSCVNDLKNGVHACKNQGGCGNGQPPAAFRVKISLYASPYTQSDDNGQHNDG